MSERAGSKTPQAAKAERFRSQATRDLLIQSSLQLFLRKGYRQTSIQEIVDAAGLTKGAFYHHFGSKDDLLLLAHENYLGSQMEILQRVTSEKLPPPAAIAKIVEDLVEGVVKHRAELSLFLEERRSFQGAAFDAVRATRREFEIALVKIMQDGVESGDFAIEKDEARIAVLAIIGMISWTYQWLRPSGDDSAAKTAAVMTKIILNGLAKDR